MNINYSPYFLLASLAFGLFSQTSLGAACPASSDNIGNVTSCIVDGSASDIKLNFISGFDSSTTTTPQGGNNGTTIGEQRRLAFIKAAEILAEQIVSTQMIEVDAQFSALECSSNSAILGSAGATNSFAYQEGIDVIPATAIKDTFYPVALANALSNSDLLPDASDIQANFNSNLGMFNCLSGGGWYYGFDDNTKRSTGFLTVLLHEVTHGLGFTSLTDPVTGKKPADMDDIFSNFLYIKSEAKTWTELSTSNSDNIKRKNSAVSGSNLFWNGQNANDLAIGKLTSGFSDNDSSFDFTSGDRIQMYAPNPLEPGSSVSHFDISASPNELMEPNLALNACDIGLALGVLEDIGWAVTLPDNNDFYLNIHCQQIKNGETYINGFDGDSIKITPVSDTDSYTYSLTYESVDASDLIQETDNGLIINTKSNGEFAGTYELTVSNSSDPDITITINRPLRLIWSSHALLNNEKYTLRIEGGGANKVYDLTQSETGTINFLNLKNESTTFISAINSPSEYNPALLNITSNTVTSPLTVETTVSSQDNTYDDVSSTVTVYPSILHSFTVTDTSNSAISNANIVIGNSSLIEEVGIDRSLTTNSTGTQSLYLPDTSNIFSVKISKTNYISQIITVDSSNTSHKITLVSNQPSENVTQTTPKFGSGGGGSLPVWFIALSGLFLIRRSRPLRH
jgi:hypothetical protein